jgi:hypothetical protein
MPLEIARVSQMARRIAPDSPTVLRIAAQRLARDSRTTARIIAAQLLARVNRASRTIAVQLLALDSRTTIARDSRTAHAPALPKTGTCHAPVLRTMLVRTMAPATMLPVVLIMLLGPALLTIGLLLRRTAMLRATTVVRRNRFRVHLLQIGQIRPRSSNLVNTQAHGRRTTVRRNRHKRGPRIIVLRKLRR